MGKTQFDDKVASVVSEHYRRLGQDYDSHLMYSPQFVRMHTRRMISMLDLQPDDVMADLGCGTGMYSRDILKQVALNESIIGVEPFKEMLDNIPAEENIQPVHMCAATFSQEKRCYDKVLIKETIHHVLDRPSLFRNLFRNMSNGGRLLLVHVPPALSYPLFSKALERNLTWLIHPDQLTQELEEAGFEVMRDSLDYPHSIPKQNYFNMVRAKYMSVLSSFSDEEIEEGIREMEERYAGHEVLEFTDHFDYLCAVKSS